MGSEITKAATGGRQGPHMGMREGRAPPLIVIGMHRSGTSMLTRTLQGFGLYMGRGTTRNEECAWTNALNEWIFRQASATWERPEGVDSLLADPQARAMVTDYLAGVTSGPAAMHFLGLRRWLRWRGMDAISGPWGWKDPRNTFTLPFWLDVFPDARVLHITRHGVDVAQSLRSRRQKAIAATQRRYQKYRWWYANHPFAPKRSGFSHSPTVRDLAGGLALWGLYMARARQAVRDRGDLALELRYEDLLAEPGPHLRTLVRFCNLQASDAALSSAAASFRPTRAYAYRHDPELVEFAEVAKELIAVEGYDP